MLRLIWLGYSSCRHLSARPAKRAAAAGSIDAAVPAVPAVAAVPALPAVPAVGAVAAAGAALPIAQLNPRRRTAKNAAGCMEGSFEYLQIMALCDLSAAARGVWLARGKDRPANSAWDSGL